jgi:tRNA pseudouridine38-40 synthase
MPKYRLIIAYDGTAYAGWQAQVGERTIEGVLKKTFFSIFNQDCSILAASRTDAGVHAAANVIRLETDIVVEGNKLLFALNNKIPSDIVIRSCERMDDFHPFYNVAQKRYYYHIFTQKPLPFYGRYGWFIAQPFDRAKFEAVLALYCGTYDFSEFTSTDDTREHKVRTIDEAYCEQSDLFPALRVVIVGKKFLHTMVRRMVGTAVYVATQPNASLAMVERMLKEHHKTDYRLKAPAQGLMLYSICYTKQNEEIKCKL